MDSQLPSEADLAEAFNTAEEIMLHFRQVARRMQERIRTVLDNGQAEPGVAVPAPPEKNNGT
jgi:hypothetical protein